MTGLVTGVEQLIKEGTDVADFLVKIDKPGIARTVSRLVAELVSRLPKEVTTVEEVCAVCEVPVYRREFGRPLHASGGGPNGWSWEGPWGHHEVQPVVLSAGKAE